jgi:hypothetical protein
MRSIISISFLTLFFISIPNTSEAQILKKIKKGIEQLKKVEDTVPKKEVETPQEKQTISENTPPELPEGYEWLQVDFNHEMMIDFNLVVFNGQLVNYNSGNTSLGGLKLNRENWNLLEVLNKYLETRGNEGSYSNLLPLINIAAREKYFCNAEIKGKHRSINTNWCSIEIGGPYADEFAKRRVEKEFEQSGILEAAQSWENKLPDKYINIIGVKLPEYSFEQKAFIFELNPEKIIQGAFKYKYYWKQSTENAEKIHDKYRNGLYRVIEPDSMDWTQNNWFYYADIGLTEKILEYKTSDMFEYRAYMKAGAPHVYTEMPIVAPIYDDKNLKQVNDWFLDFCNNSRKLENGFVSCELILPGLINHLKINQLFPRANALRASYQEPYFEKAIAQNKLIEIDDIGKPELEGYHSKRAQQAGVNEWFRGTYDPIKLINDLKEGKSTELFVTKSAFSNYIKANHSNPKKRDRTAIEDYINKYNAPSLKSSTYRRYQDINGTKNETEFMSCFISQSINIAMSYVGLLDAKSFENEVVRVAIKTCK